ncbi:MAG: hypothetical protein K2M72_03630 [Paramuribaculum sp.]|nr:hypothetical protein [Paramuribaculum sp.]
MINQEKELENSGWEKVLSVLMYLWQLLSVLIRFLRLTRREKDKDKEAD